MVELRLHLELYAPAAIDAAVRTFEPFGSIEVVDEAPYRVVRVTASSHAREKSIAGELANYALGTTIGTTEAEDVLDGPGPSSTQGADAPAGGPREGTP